MMKKINLLLVLVFALACIFTTCELDTAVRAVVKFDDPRFGNKVPDLFVVKGTGMGDKMPTLPPPPNQGVVLHGWYDGSTRYDKDTIVTKDITLTARWSDDVVTVRFAFNETDNSGNIIMPVAAVPEIQAMRGIPLSPLSVPVTPRSKGWQFDSWLLNGEPFTTESVVPGDITLEAHWVAKRKFIVSFAPGPGMAALPPIEVFENECIDEWEVPGTTRFPANPTANPNNSKAFFVAWLDDENRKYNGRTPVTRTLTITGRWGLPPYIVNLRLTADGGDIKSVVSSELGMQGTTNYGPEPQDGKGYDPVVKQAWDSTSGNPKWVIVNQRTYDVPYNPNRWRILYRVALEIQDTPDGPFDIGFYTKYTIRARFYANRQGKAGWEDDPDFKEGSFVPDVPAAEAEYSADGWLKKAGYGEVDGEGQPKEISQSNDGWGQISWLGVANWNGAGADAQTMLQRYNLDRKGGTINDDWAPANYKDKAYPPYLLVQTSDNFIGHIEIYQIVFHNGIVSNNPLEDEWIHTAYDGEVKPAPVDPDAP